MNPLANTYNATFAAASRYGDALTMAANTERIIERVRCGELVVLRNDSDVQAVVPAGILPYVVTGKEYAGFTPQVDTHDAEEALRAHALQLMGCWN